LSPVVQLVENYFFLFLLFLYIIFVGKKILKILNIFKGAVKRVIQERNHVI